MQRRGSKAKRDDDGTRAPSFSFTHTADASWQAIDQPPIQSAAPAESIPLSAFSHQASTMQAVARYLIDVRGLSFSNAARILGRNPKSIWASYHQAQPLPALTQSLSIPLAVFSRAMPPLEALVAYLRSKGLRNIDIAHLLKLSPKTTWTVAKRAEKRTEAVS